MLENCNAVAGSSKHSQTVSEYRAQFSTFAILTSPLILGKPLRRCAVVCGSFVCMCAQQLKIVITSCKQSDCSEFDLSVC